MSFADNLAALPEAGHLARIELTGSTGQMETIENQPGSQGSLRLYAYLAEKSLVLDPAAAQEGLALYAEHTADAEANPGKHSNIDRLFRVAAGDLTYRLNCVQV